MAKKSSKRAAQASTSAAKTSSSSTTPEPAKAAKRKVKAVPVAEGPLVIETVRIADLRTDPGNARLHPDSQVRVIAASLRRFGQRKPIVVTEDGMLVAGHGTLLAAQSLGWDSIQAVRARFSSDEARIAYGLADNRTAELAEWDIAKLNVALANVDDSYRQDFLFTNDALAAIKDTTEDSSEQIENRYTPKIASPIYKVTGECPQIADLYDDQVTQELEKEIAKSNLPKDISAFLSAAAKRHTQFHFGRIAEYYAHANETIQRLMENSGLIIVDWDKAVELGFVKLTDDIQKIAKAAGMLTSGESDEK